MTRIFTIDGNIGSGKSTLLNHLKQHCKSNQNIIFADEPVSEWQSICDKNGSSMLEKFYKDQKKYSFSFQMMAYISRLDILRKIVKQNPDSIIVTERSLHTDRLVFAKMLFDSELIEDVNYQIYLKWFDTFIEDYPISGVIYVKTNPQVCFDRIKQRSRIGESEIPLDYLTKCDEYHDNMMKEIFTLSTNILTLDGNQDIFNEPDSLSNWLKDIDLYIQ